MTQTPDRLNAAATILAGMPSRISLRKRFLSKVKNNTPDECWVWSGCINSAGYGLIYEGDGSHKILLAHRVSYELFIGPIPDKMQLDHKCHNRPCVNPYHLRPCTHSENCRNSTRPTNGNTQMKGIHWDKEQKKWRACIHVNDKTIHLGRFLTQELAHAAYCHAARKLHGEFANFGDEKP